MARETWLIQANPDEFLEKLLEGVEAKGEEEHLKIHKVCFSLSLSHHIFPSLFYLSFSYTFSTSLSLPSLVPRLLPAFRHRE